MYTVDSLALIFPCTFDSSSLTVTSFSPYSDNQYIRLIPYVMSTPIIILRSENMPSLFIVSLKQPGCLAK